MGGERLGILGTGCIIGNIGLAGRAGSNLTAMTVRGNGVGEATEPPGQGGAVTSNMGGGSAIKPTRIGGGGAGFGGGDQHQSSFKENLASKEKQLVLVAVFYNRNITGYNGPSYDFARVEQGGVLKLEYHPPAFAGDVHYVDIVKEDYTSRLFDFFELEFRKEAVQNV